MPYVDVTEGPLYYEEEGRGVPLVLLHGFAENGAALASLRAAFRDRYRVIVPDLPGQGRSGPQPRAYGVDFYERDAQAVGDLLDRLGEARCHMAGFSDGGEVALLLAILRPALVLSAIAWGVAGALEPGALAEVAAVGALVDAPAPRFAAWRAELIATYGVTRVRAMTTGWAAALRQLIAAGGDISLSRAGLIRCPVLLINGADDALNPPAAGRRLATTIPHVDLIVVPGVGHAVHVERAAWFIATVRAWLEHAP